MKNIKIINICKQKLIFLNYSLSTQNTYLYHISEFVKSMDKQIIHCNSNDLNLYIRGYKYTSISQQNQVINSIRFLYKYGLNKKYNKVSFQRPKREYKLPKVIDKTYLLSCISNIENIKHRAIISISYSVGLRVSEVLNLKIKDVDSNRMVINIRQSKGRKDRVVPLTENILQLLRSYYKLYKPTEYLFNGQNNIKYSHSSCNKIVKRYLGTKYHFHCLRHSCFTHLTDQSVDIRVIQKLAGHSSSKTTEIYTRVSTRIICNLPLSI